MLSLSICNTSTAPVSTSEASTPTPFPVLAQNRRILVATQISHSSFLKGLSLFAKTNAWQLITDMLHTGTLPKRWDGDGILAFAPYRSQINSYVLGSNRPCVTVSMSNDCKSIPRIQPDNHAIGKMAAQHLIARKCRRFIWAPYVDDTSNLERLHGFISELRSIGCTCEILPPAHRQIGSELHDDWSAWKQTATQAFRSLDERTGLFAFNDCLSAELANIAADCGLAVPEQLAILGVGNETIECESAATTLSSVDPDLESMAFRAAELLHRILDGHPAPTDPIKVPPKQIICRESTAISTSENPRTELALVYIAENFANPSLNVAAVAESLGISRRQLERDFRADQGYTVREYIEKTRMDEASRLLIQLPQKSVACIAKRVGISASGNFFRIFRKCFNTTPSDFRAQQLSAH